MRKEVGLQELGWTLDHLVLHVLSGALLPLIATSQGAFPQ